MPNIIGIGRCFTKKLLKNCLSKKVQNVWIGIQKIPGIRQCCRLTRKHFAVRTIFLFLCSRSSCLWECNRRSIIWGRTTIKQLQTTTTAGKRPGDGGKTREAGSCREMENIHWLIDKFRTSHAYVLSADKTDWTSGRTACVWCDNAACMIDGLLQVLARLITGSRWSVAGCIDNSAVGLQGAAKKWTPKVFRCFLSNRLGF